MKTISRPKDLLFWSTEIQAIAQTGLAYSKDGFDLERYHQLLDIAAEMLSYRSEGEQDPIQSAFLQQRGYASPKIDVRAFILNEQQQILLAKERQDGKWSLPGGWADVNHTPSESVIKEVFEETGYSAKVESLLALWDTALHEHPPHWPYIYKSVFYCTVIEGQWRENNEILAVDYFDIDALPELSLYRITPRQLETLHQRVCNQQFSTLFD